MAIRRHRLPRFWLALTLGLVATGVGAAHWWEARLPDKLREAAAAGDFEACLRYSDQLASLRWMSGRSPSEQGHCRRVLAKQLWGEQRWQDALRLQLLLVNSVAGSPEDRRRLQDWQEELKGKALKRFEAGDLEGAMAFLKPMGEHHNPGGNALGDSLREFWNRNRLQQDRARKLVAEKRWWEALDALNRIDHPWWKRQSADLQRKVEAAIRSPSVAEHKHDSHGDATPGSVPSKELDAAVQRHLKSGLDDWTAFTKACRDLGGTVVESGPESACRR